MAWCNVVTWTSELYKRVDVVVIRTHLKNKPIIYSQLLFTELNPASCKQACNFCGY